MGPGADTWEILQTSIGQGTTQVTPMHNAMITAAIANGGTLMKPYFLNSVETAGGEEIKKFMPASYGSLMTAGEAEGLTELMRTVVTEGTGSAVRTDAYTVAAKTGSAEFETGKETHAWFTGFAPVENPKLVVTVLVEEGGSGGKAAAPIARQLFDIYMAR
jgi:penicillin-binding protein A